MIPQVKSVADSVPNAIWGKILDFAGGKMSVTLSKVSKATYAASKEYMRFFTEASAYQNYTERSWNLFPKTIYLARLLKNENFLSFKKGQIGDVLEILKVTSDEFHYAFINVAFNNRINPNYHTADPECLIQIKHPEKYESLLQSWVSYYVDPKLSNGLLKKCHLINSNQVSDFIKKMSWSNIFNSRDSEALNFESEPALRHEITVKEAKIISEAAKTLSSRCAPIFVNYKVSQEAYRELKKNNHLDCTLRYERNLMPSLNKISHIIATIGAIIFGLGAVGLGIAAIALSPGLGFLFCIGIVAALPAAVVGAGISLGLYYVVERIVNSISNKYFNQEQRRMHL